MKKQTVLLTSLVFWLTCTVPSWGQGPYMRQVVQNIKNMNASGKGLKGMILSFEDQYLANKTTDFFRASEIKNWILNAGNSQETNALSWPEKTYLFSGEQRFLSKQQIKEILSQGEESSNIENLGEINRDDLYLIGFPEQILEESFSPSSLQLEKALMYYRKTLIELGQQAPSLEVWGKSMSVISNLGLFGNAQDAKAIIQTAERFKGPLIGTTDLIAVRSLINIGCYADIETLAKIRLSARTPEGARVKLAYPWIDIKEYVINNHLEVSLSFDATRRVNQQPLVLSDEMRKVLEKYNPYNSLQESSASHVTDFWVDLRQGIDSLFKQAEMSMRLATQLQETPSIFQAFNKMTLDDLQQFVNRTDRKPRVRFGRTYTEESDLARRVQHILNTYPVHSPEFMAINDIYNRLEERKKQLEQPLKTQEKTIKSVLQTPEQILVALQAFKTKFNRNPIPYSKANKLSPEDLEESLLANAVKKLVRTSNPQDPYVLQVKDLWREKTNEKSADDLDKLYKELFDFIAENLRRPRISFSSLRNGFSILDLEEKALSEKITEALEDTKSSNPSLQALRDLWESAPATGLPDSEKVIQKAERFLEEHNGRWPQRVIYKDGKPLPPQKYSREEAQEVALAKMMSLLWNRRNKEDIFRVWLRQSGQWKAYE